MPDVTLDLSLIQNNLANDANAIRTALLALQATVNDLDNANIAPGAGIVDTKLAAPNNAVWRTLAEQRFLVGAGLAAGTYWFDHIASAVVSGGGSGPAPVKLDPADFPVGGKVARLMLRVSLLTGGAPGIAPVFGLYPISALAGTTSVQVTLGGVVAGSTATFAALVGASTGVSQDSSAFSFPGAVGQYMFGVSLPAPTAGASAISGLMQLLISHV